MKRVTCSSPCATSMELGGDVCYVKCDHNHVIFWDCML